MQDDSRDRFDRLFKANYEPILRYAARRVGPEGAHDVAAEAFLVAWRRQDRVPRAEGEHLPWLYGVARQVIANEQRGRRRRDRLRERLRAERVSGRSAPVTEAGSLLSAMNRLSPTVDAALVYKTDVPAAAGKVIGIDFPEADKAINDYPIAPLTKAPNAALARQFVDLVLSPTARA